MDIINSLKKIFHEQSDTNTHDLETEKSPADRRNQQGQGLKTLTPNQMVSRLSTFLAQLKARKSSEKLKNEIRQLLYIFYRSKNLQNISIIIWSTLFKNGNNFYKHWKQIEPNRFKLDLTNKLNLKNLNKKMALANLSICYPWKNITSEYNNNKFKIFAPTWNDIFDLPDGSYSISDIQDYFEFIIKKQKTWPRIHQFKFVQIKSKTNCFQNKDQLVIRTVNSWNNEIARKYKKACWQK